MKNVKRVISYIIVGVFVLLAAAILFLILSPSYEARIVRSESMKGAMNMGDVVIMGPAKDISNIKPDMIISFMRGQEMVAHRVVSVEGDNIQTKGDAMEDNDPWLVPFSDVRGIYLLKVPYLGYVSYFARTPIGWGLLVIFPATLLVGYIVWDLFRKKEPKKAVPAKVKARNSNSGSSAKVRGNNAGSSAKARVRSERRQRATSH